MGTKATLPLNNPNLDFVEYNIVYYEDTDS